jgi:hypothetical protein
MSPFARLLLIPAALSMGSTSIAAKEIKGAPKELIGYYAENAKACRSAYQNAFEKITIISEGKYWGEFSDCADNNECRAKILTHRPTSSGYSLKLLYSDSVEWAMTVTRVKKNTYKFLSKDSEPTIFIRCRPEDVTAELGRRQRHDSEEENNLYSYSYALAAGESCPGLEVATERFPSNFNWNVNYPWEQGNPLGDFEFAHRYLRTFCHEILGAFGNKGRVIPNLIRAVPADAKSFAGAPKILEGVFADRAEQCPRWNENGGRRIDIGDSFLDSCGARICERSIASHRVVPDGFVLNIREWHQKGNGPTSLLKIKVIDRDTFVYIAPNPTILHRCPFED